MSVWRSLIVLTITVLLIPVGAALLRANQALTAQQQEQQRLQSMETYMVRRGDVQTTVSALGAVEADDTVDLAFRTSGDIDEVLVETGDYVYAGQPLARLDSTTQRIDYEQARLTLQQAALNLEDLLAPVDEADIREAEANVNSAQGNYTDIANAVSPESLQAAELEYQQAIDQYQRLQEQRSVSGGLSQIEVNQLDAQIGEASFNTEIARLNLESLKNNNDSSLNEAGARIALAQAQLDQTLAGASDSEINDADIQLQTAEADLRDAETALNRTTLVATLDGIVSGVDIEVGQTVSEGTAVIEITDRSPLYFIAQVDEMDIDVVSANTQTYLVLDALPDVQFSLTLDHFDWLGTETDGVVSYDTTFLLGDDPRLMVGMTGEAFIVQQAQHNVLVVPNNYLNTDPKTGGITVEVLQPDRSTVVTPVTVGLQGEEYSEIVTGLTDGMVLARFETETAEMR